MMHDLISVSIERCDIFLNLKKSNKFVYIGNPWSNMKPCYSIYRFHDI